MKKINRILSLFLAMCLCSTLLQAQPFNFSPLPVCWKNDSLALNTGIDWLAPGFYNPDAGDGYWSIVSSTTGPVPRCATVWNQNFTDCRAISDVNLNPGQSPNNTNVLCGVNNTQYIFRRSFWVDFNTPANNNATLVLQLACDDAVQSVTFNGNQNLPLPNLLWSVCNHFTSNPVPYGSFPVVLQQGLNFLDIEIKNNNFSGGTAGDSPMTLVIRGDIISLGNPVFVKNDRFLPNNLSTAQPWGCDSGAFQFQHPDMYACVPAGADSGFIWLQNPYPGWTYSVSPGTFDNTSTPKGFWGNLTNTYTVTATDPEGCTLTSVVNNTEGPNVNVTPNVFCATTATDTVTALVTMDSINGWYSLEKFHLQGYPPLDLPTSILAGSTQNFKVGLYSIKLTDSMGCYDSALVVHNLVDLYAYSDPGPKCAGSPSALQVSPLNSMPIDVGSTTYNWIPFGWTTNPILPFTTPPASTTYTCVATSSYGCSDSIAVPVVVLPVPTVTITNDQAPCSPTYTANVTGGTAPYQYQWNWAFTGTGQTIVAPAYSPPSPPINSSLWLQVTDSNGCVGNAYDFYAQNVFCCNMATALDTNTIKISGGGAPYIPPTATALIAAIGVSGNVITTNNPIVINGNFTIDTDIQFLNCPNMLMLPNSSMSVNTGNHLYFKNCRIAANCREMWGGIYVGSASSQVTMYDCIVRDMAVGVRAMSNAKLDLQRNTFSNNYYAIQLINGDAADYVEATGKCRILSNQFTSDGMNLLSPYDTLQRGFMGIRNTRCRTFEVGKLDFGQSMNTFSHLVTGIHITPATPSLTLAQNYYVHDNRFEDIRNTNNYTEVQINANLAGNNVAKGSAIFVTPADSNARLHCIVDGDMNCNFENCDIAISGNAVSATIKGNCVTNCLFGFMMKNANKNSYTIQNNLLTHFNSNDPSGNPIVGISLQGSGVLTTGTQIEQNKVYVRDQPIFGTTQYGSGIRYTALSNNAATTFGALIYENEVYVPGIAGTGINVQNGNATVRVSGNSVFFNNTSGLALAPSGTNVIAAGIHLNNCKGSGVTNNLMKGTMSYVNNNNSISGMHIVTSTDCIIGCNSFEKTRFGLFVGGDCGTNINSVSRNKFNTHKRGMNYRDVGSSLGGFGNIGSLTQDNNNQFIDWNTTNQYTNNVGIWREGNSSLSYPGKIYTTQIPFLFSDAPASNQRYNVQSNPGASVISNNTCNYPVSNLQLMANNMNTNEALELLEELEGNQSENIEATDWMKEQELLEALRIDENLRNSDMDLWMHYQDQINSIPLKLLEIDALFDSLGHDDVAYDSLKKEQLLAFIQQRNNNLEGNNPIENNLLNANKYLLLALQNQIQETDDTTIEAIKTLAYSCPLQVGPGVYKARYVAAMLNQNLDYNDAFICNNATLNKTDESLEEQVSKINEEKICKVYPNPASDVLRVSYSIADADKAEFLLYDLLGNVKLKVPMEGGNGYENIDIKQLPRGTYHYRFVVNAIDSYSNTIILK